MVSPSSFAVCALKFLQKSMMFTPCGPSAVPTGGAGVALPAAIWSFTIAWIFLAIVLYVTAETAEFAENKRARRAQRARRLDFHHLQEIQLDGCGPPEDRHH